MSKKFDYEPPHLIDRVAWKIEEIIVGEIYNTLLAGMPREEKLLAATIAVETLAIKLRKTCNALNL
jgi:hypothetical protein